MSWMKLFLIILGINILSELSAVAGPCEWLDRELLNLSETDDRELLAAFEAIPEGETKSSWIERMKDRRDELNASVPGKTVIDQDAVEFQRVVDGVVIGSVRVYRPGIDKVGGNIVRLHGDVIQQYQGQGVFKVLVLEAFLRNSRIKAIWTTLSGTNTEVVEHGLRNGLSFMNALKETPAYKVRKEIGFTEIVYARSTGSGEAMMIEFVVGRSNEIMD